MPRYIHLVGRSADWYEHQGPAVDTIDRHRVLIAAIDIAAKLKDAAVGTTVFGDNDNGIVLRLQIENEGKILVTILGKTGGITAAFGFTPNYATDRPQNEPEISELIWRHVAVPPDTPIEELNLPLHAYDALRREGIDTIGQLVQKTDADLLEIRKFGLVSLKAVDTALTAHSIARQR